MFSCHYSLSLCSCLFYPSPPLSCRYFMHGLTAWINQSHVDYATHWHPSSRLDTKQNQHLHASTLEILSFSTVSEKRKVYRFRQDCEHSATFALCRQMFILCGTEPVYNTEIVSHSHYVYYILNGILRECFFWHMNHSTNATAPQILLSILQRAQKKVPFSWSSLFHSLNYLLGGRRRTFKLRRCAHFCLS